MSTNPNKRQDEDEDVVALWWIFGGLVVVFGLTWFAYKLKDYKPGTPIASYFTSEKANIDTVKTETPVKKDEHEGHDHAGHDHDHGKHAIVKEELGKFKEDKLPDGITLEIPELGIESKLLAFIKDNAKPVDKTTWFDFDRLLFETGSSKLKPESQEQLENIVKILKAYPNVEIKIGGYTDNVGNPANNLKLSQERADAVKAEMVKLGVTDTRVASEGYGDQFPVADNNTEEGRDKNRRVSVRVTKK
ncbi:MAG: OmpA family protein [Raineya sp.]|jgi:outer membrane protein OmpA-like peptidoglycan-associated protein|nr:OmpA family protein [Raineya sp.]